MSGQYVAMLNDWRSIEQRVIDASPLTRRAYPTRLKARMRADGGLISRIPGLHYGFFSVSVFFLVFSYRYFLPFKFFCLRSLNSPITVCFFIFIFLPFLVPFKTF